MIKKERGLGRGLDALFSNNIEEETCQIEEVSVEDIIACFNQPRKKFDEESLQELADSIQEHGILQPILVRPIGDRYEIIAGERRWRAAQIAGLEIVPALVREMEDKEVAEVSLIENLQREDLSVLEEAFAYKNMVEKHEYTQESLSERIGKSRAHIANTIRLLLLPDEILKMIEDKQLSAGHARTLLSLENTDEQIMVAREIVNGKMSVRKTEEKVKRVKEDKGKSINRSVEIRDIEDQLQRFLGSRAEIMAKRKGGKISIPYFDEEDLERILELIGCLKMS
ncbi:MAG: ParB/RepB/Spo0J family partition protein [Bacillota bacterium]|nr:ParB/RepB/Spo0J family partition protein [Bacillota bacterium]